MACPSSGELSLNKIYNEVDNDNYNAGISNTNISLTNLSDGTVDTINTGNASSDRPDGSAPHEMSEFYSYDHDLVKSDIRLKTNIQLLGYSDLNIPIYSFKFKNDLNITYKGVMAQDLLEMNLNDAVVLDSDGFYSVKYDDIDVDFEVL